MGWRDRVLVRWVAAGLLAATMVAGTSPSVEAYYSSTWYEDADGYGKALRQQHSAHVPVLVYFRVDWCPHCRALDELLDEHEVRTRTNQVIKVRINPEHGEREKALFKEQYGASGYPAVFLLGEGGASTRLSNAGPPERFLRQLPAAEPAGGDTQEE